MNRELPIRVIVLRPPAGVLFAIQRGRSALLAPSRARAESLVFDFSVRIAHQKVGGAPNILGPYVYGTRADPFFYLNSGIMAGQVESSWTRRAKVKTAGISWTLVEQTLATTGAVLEAQVEGQTKDGGPCCGTVPLVGADWRMVR